MGTLFDKKKIGKKIFLGPDLHQAKFGVISFSVVIGRGYQDQKIRVVQNDLKHISVLEFLRCDEMF